MFCCQLWFDRILTKSLDFSSNDKFYSLFCCIWRIIFPGVVKELRKQGIASFLLENLIAHLTTPDCSEIKGLYLHVLTTNNAAITFYEHRGFRPHVFLPYYYAIGGRRRDGFTYVLYLNGGHAPWSILDYVSNSCQICLGLFNPWALTKSLFRKVNLAWFNAMPRIRQIAHGSTAVFSWRKTLHSEIQVFLVQ